MTGSYQDWGLYWRLPPKDQNGAPASDDAILDRFLDFVSSKNLELYPAQEDAILHLFQGKNIILNTPTGSGKSLVALALHFYSLAKGRRSIYTCPIKALVNEKFRDLCRDFGPDQVGMVTGDGSVNPNAPILCCTAEILANMALRLGAEAPVDDIIMDEFHYYSDKQRGVAWQIPLLTLSRGRFLLMSATLGDVEFFEKELQKITGRESLTVSSTDRPVPLEFEYRETPLHETIADLVTKGHSPIYLVNFSQREAAESAQNILSQDFATKEEKKKISEALSGFKFQSPYGKELQKFLRHGLGIHHAGLLPKYRGLVEQLAQKGLLKVICGTDTLGVGVNVPIRTVLFTKLCKYDGNKTAILSVRDFHQICGRAGRRGYDTRGYVAAQAPEHVIENLRMKRKAADDPKKLRKIVSKTPPPHGFVMWTQETFQKLITSKPESLTSSFNVHHGLLLNVLSRHEDGCNSMQKLIHDCHEPASRKKLWFKKSFELFRSLLDRKIVEIKKLGSAYKISINVDLQEDFSLNQSLSLYLLDTLLVLDKTQENYSLDCLTLVESILESPDLILRKQLDRVKTERMMELKAQGMEYDERIEELEKCEYPKPNREFIYETFNIFSEAHPWVGQENIRPKSIAREMYENFYAFADYIREYDLQRGEGLLLRYLSEVYKVLVQTVPEAHKTEEIRAMTIYFGTMLRGVDSSLLDEWEKMRAGHGIGTELRQGKVVSIEVPLENQEPDLAPDITADRRGFLLLIRNEVQHFIRALSQKDYEEALSLIAAPTPEQVTADSELKTWTVPELETSLSEFYTDHRRICSDLKAFHPSHGVLIDNKNKKGQALNAPWIFEQRLVDPDGFNDWQAEFLIDREQSKTTGHPVVLLIGFRSL
jgi:hypothetical protein